MAQMHSVRTDRDHLEASVRMAKDQCQQLVMERDEQGALARKERSEL